METVEQQGLSEDQDIQSIDTSEIESPHNQGAQSLDKPIISVSVKTDERKRLAKKDVMPTWAATRSLLLSKTQESITRTNTEVIAPLFKTSPTDITTLYTVLMLTQGVSAVVVGPERKTIITLDLDLYSRALQIQQTVGNTNWVLRAGVLHIVFAALHALGKTLDGSGIDTCAVESGTFTSAALRGIYGGKAYKRGIEYHITTCLAILMMLFDANAKEPLPDLLRTQCDSLQKALHERSPDANVIFENIQTWYTENIKLNERENAGEQAQFMLEYLEQAGSPLKSLVSSALVPSDAKNDILNFAEKGQARFQDFINERLLSTSTISVWDPMKKLKLKTFSNWMEKIKVRTGDKVIKLREERELFGRFLIIQGSRPELVPKLEDAIGEYEMSVVPRSLCAVDGSLYIPTDKACLMHVIEAAKTEPRVPDLPETTTVDYRDRALVVDAMAVVQSMKKNPTMRTLADLKETFVKRIEHAQWFQ